jgi:parallel beta-helix repeat protein
MLSFRFAARADRRGSPPRGGVALASDPGVSPRPFRAHGRRRQAMPRAWVAGATSLLVAGLGLGAAVASAPAALAATTATGGQGASLPYAEVQAELSPTTGTVIGPSYTQGQLADEASGREAVTLGTGQSVTFTSPVATNSIDFRYSIPDTSDGSVYSAALSLYIDGTKQPDFSLTNAYSWYYGSYPFTNTPSSGNPHHFFDEVHRLFATTYPAGTTFKLQVDSEDTASSYTIDFADFEDVPAALPQPSGSVSVTSEGADPTGVNDSTNAFNAALAAAGAGGTVWIPPGTYNIPGHLMVNDVTLEGAGMWYSTITGTAPGIYGNSAPNPSTNVHLANFAIFGNVQERCDSCQVNGIGGAMSNSTVSNIWIEHDKVGAWMDGPMTNLTFSGMRIRDTTADGINFHGGVTASTVTNSDIRNTGDDGIATWADAGVGADANDTISNNTVQLQQLANGIAIYGGNNNTVTGNKVVDTGITQGGGITVAQRFSSTTLGQTTVSNNTLIRDGDLDPNWQFGVGALWFDAHDGTINAPIDVSNLLIEQSPYEAIQWVEGQVSGVSLSDVTITGTGTFALQEQTPGAVSLTDVTATGVATSSEPAVNSPDYNCEGSNFTVTDNGGNSGVLGTAYCGPWPAPVYPPPPPQGVTASPTALNFGSQVTGTSSSARTVTLTNNNTSAASVSAIAASGDYSETNNCGSSIAGGASCTVNVTFTPTTTGPRTGTLTAAAGGTTATVSLSGTGTAPGPNLSASPASLSFGKTVVGASGGSQTATITNTGTAAAAISSIAVTAGGSDFTETNNCGASLAVNASCTVTVGFTPSAAGARSGTVSVSSNAVDSPTTVGLSGSGIGTSTNVALNQPTTASGSQSGYPSANAVDGNTSTYWESTNNAFPQWLQVDLGQALPIGKIVLTLPPSTSWGARTQTLSVLGSTNGTSYTTIVPSNTYTFDPNNGNNTVTITFPSTTTRYVQLNFTANSGWPAGQVSEFEVFPAGSGGGGGSGSASLSVSPSSLSFGSETVGSSTTTQTVTISNSGSAAAAINVATTGDFAQTNNCGTSLAPAASCTASVTFDPTVTGSRTGTLTATASGANSATVSLTGTGTASSSTNLALAGTMTASSYTQTYAPSNANDGNTSSYWESANGAFPQWLEVNLNSAQTVGSITLTLPPSSAWQTRTQTLSVLGSTNGSSWTTLVASATYTWDPSTGNTVTISLPSSTEQYLQLDFTANSVQNAGQVSEFEVFS